MIIPLIASITALVTAVTGLIYGQKCHKRNQARIEQLEKDRQA